MIPKVDSCVRAVRSGVRRAHILDGRIPHVLLLELFTDDGIGTMVRIDPTETSRSGADRHDHRPSPTAVRTRSTPRSRRRRARSCPCSVHRR